MMADEHMKCSNCGAKHKVTKANCCWIHCGCGERICGGCGGSNLAEMDMPEDDDEAQYWCCEHCEDCGLEGCAMCI